MGLLLVLALCILYLPFLFILKKRGHSPIRQLAWLGFGCAVFLIVFAAYLFMPISLGAGSRFSCNLIPLHFLVEEDALRLLVTEKIPNIMLFIPLGLFMPLVFPGVRRVSRTLLCALGLTLFIEISQFFIGRSADIDDVITNFTGAAIGWGIYKTAEKCCGQTNLWRKITNQK